MIFLLLGILCGTGTVVAFINGHLLIAAGLFLMTVALLGMSGLRRAEAPLR